MLFSCLPEILFVLIVTSISATKTDHDFLDHNLLVTVKEIVLEHSHTPHCVIEFNYATKCDLQIVLERLDASTVIWDSRLLTTVNRSNLSKAFIGKQENVVKVQFKQIANCDLLLSDLQFLNCDEMDIVANDTHWEGVKGHLCDNGHIVDYDRVCDLVDDCGDNTDEDLEICKPELACNFNQRSEFCFFNHSQWTISEVFGDLIFGPTRSHSSLVSNSFAFIRNDLTNNTISGLLKVDKVPRLCATFYVMVYGLESKLIVNNQIIDLDYSLPGMWQRVLVPQITGPELVINVTISEFGKYIAIDDFTFGRNCYDPNFDYDGGIPTIETINDGIQQSGLDVGEPQSNKVLINRDPVIAISISAFLLVIITSISIVTIRNRIKRRKRERELFEKNLNYYPIRKEFSGSFSGIGYNSDWELDLRNLKVDKSLGSGNFGKVFTGTVTINTRKLRVAIKIASTKRNADQVTSLIQELGSMITIGHHLNVLKLIGAITKDVNRGQLLLITELCDLGNLKDFMKTHRHQFDIDKEPLNFNKLNYFCFQIAIGMQYISSKGFVHRDLAARNVFLTFDHTIKIGDFGMAMRLNEIRPDETIPIAIKWTAPESLQFKQWSTKSDVWSFGITIWEIFAFGETPYKNLSADLDFVKFLKKGIRLAKSEICGDEIYKLMTSCWNFDPTLRPSFDELANTLYELIDPEARAYYSNLSIGRTRAQCETSGYVLVDASGKVIY